MYDLSTRRSFIRQSAAIGAGLFLAPHLRAQGSNEAVRVGVIGLRGRGGGLMNEVLRTKHARLVALCDVDPSVLDARVAAVEKKGHKVSRWKDFRKLCESNEIDAVVVATPNHLHSIIGMTAAVNGKHAYVEKPVSQNVREGQLLAEAQEKTGVIIQHGFQRRSEHSWRDAFEWLNKGPIGKLKVARGFCYKPRKSIGKVKGAQVAPEGLDYNLWCGPRPMQPIMRQRFHYDWHWQFNWGNGDLGNQGPHQLDVCRWALGDPAGFPLAMQSFGGRFAHDDDGDWANTQVVALEFEKAPIIFEVRGLPKKDVNYKSGMDSYRGQSIGNVIEYEGGALIGGHGSHCHVVDAKGEKIKSFKGGDSHMQTWVDAIRSGKQEPGRGARSGHLSSALAHLGNTSWLMGSPLDGDPEIVDPIVQDAYERMMDHLKANGVKPDSKIMKIGPQLLGVAGEEKLIEEHELKASHLLKSIDRPEFALPKI